MVAAVDGRTYVRTNGWKTRSLYRAMPEAGKTKETSDCTLCEGLNRCHMQCTKICTSSCSETVMLLMYLCTEGFLKTLKCIRVIENSEYWTKPNDEILKKYHLSVNIVF